MTNPDCYSPMSPPTQTEPATVREPKARWKPTEEKALVSAWLNTSKDSIVGNEQRGDKFWDRVAAYYAACHAVSKLSIRESNTCKQKWQKMSGDVMKFAGCYEAASRTPRSGLHDNDDILLAHKLYFQDHKVKFSLDHVWRLLKDKQKWTTFCKSKSKPVKKKSKLNDGASSTTSTASKVDEDTEEDTVQRPMGVKAAKALAKKRGKGKTEDCEATELKSLWVVKEKDLTF